MILKKAWVLLSPYHDLFQYLGFPMKCPIQSMTHMSLSEGRSQPDLSSYHLPIPLHYCCKGMIRELFCSVLFSTVVSLIVKTTNGSGMWNPTNLGSTQISTSSFSKIHWNKYILRRMGVTCTANWILNTWLSGQIYHAATLEPASYVKLSLSFSMVVERFPNTKRWLWNV